VTDNISSVRQAANDAGVVAGDVLSAATGLSQQTEQLNMAVSRFVAGVRG
jgi:methyl-accepting chemotaxis protein